VTFAAMLGAISVLDRFEQSTLILRLYFWQVAISMLRERPFTGFGFDSYGDWYPKFRDQGIVDLYGLGLTSNSPHNIFLDVASSSGALVFVLYIILYMWIFYKAIKHLTSGPVDWFFTFTFASWLGYVAQGFISVNSLALAIIGNCLGGLLLSRCISNPGIDNRLSKSKNFSDVARSKILSSFLGLVVGFALQ
jgi:O-antigen ligase